MTIYKINEYIYLTCFPSFFFIFHLLFSIEFNAKVSGTLTLNSKVGTNIFSSSLGLQKTEFVDLLEERIKKKPTTN